MQIRFIFFLIVATVVVIFAAQNNSNVAIVLFTYKLENVPVSVVILASMLFGALVMALFQVISYIGLK